MTFLRIIIFLCILLFQSCTSKSVRDKAAFISRYYAKTIILPDFEPENVGFSGINIRNGSEPASTIVVYTDGDCGKCIIDLLLWQDFIEKHRDKLVSTTILFIAHSWHYPSFERQLAKAGVTLPQLFDGENEYIDLNDLHHTLLHTLLLDSTNSVVLVGSPLNNEKLTELYFREIKRLNEKPDQFRD